MADASHGAVIPVVVVRNGAKTVLVIVGDDLTRLPEGVADRGFVACRQGSSLPFFSTDSPGLRLEVLRKHDVRLAPGEPVQGPTDRRAFEYRGHRITPVASFELEALVLGRRDYDHDRGAQVSPVDLALGWGPMSNPQILSEVPISQSGRWYRFRIQTLRDGFRWESSRSREDTGDGACELVFADAIRIG